MASFETEGVVLKQFDLGESDRLITLYTKEKGKIRAVARGARKGIKSRSGLVLPFSYHNFVLYQGKSLARINHIESIEMNSRLRDDLDYMAYASVVSEYIERAGLEDEKDLALFSLLVLILREMNSTEKKNLLFYFNFFKTKLLILLGIKPELKKCTYCNEQINYNEINFNIEHGGVVCRGCIEKFNADYKSLNRKEFMIFAKFINSTFADIADRTIEIDTGILKKISSLTEEFIAYHLDLKPKSLSFLYNLQNMNGDF
ncbi:MAG: DNA repair protein RecO [Bacillota bacterium]